MGAGVLLVGVLSKRLLERWQVSGIRRANSCAQLACDRMHSSSESLLSAFHVVPFLRRIAPLKTELRSSYSALRGRFAAREIVSELAFGRRGLNFV